MSDNTPVEDTEDAADKGRFAWLRKRKILLGNIGLVLTMLIGLAYLSFGALNWRPWTDQYGLTINFPISGGLQDTSGVALRGARIGDVESIQVRPESVEVKVKIDSDVKINRNSTVYALGLSAAGEQYVDFKPDTDEGPYFEDGDTIEVGQTDVTVPFAQMLETSLSVIEQVDPAALTTVTEELTVAVDSDQGNQLRAIFNSAGVLFADMYQVMPQTTALIAELGTIFETTADIQPDLGRLLDGGSAVVEAAAAADAELRTLLDDGPGQMTELGESINEIRDPISGVLTQFLDIARQGALRAPTVANLLPSIRDGAYAAQAMFHNGAWWTLGSAYPKPYCDYAITPQRPTKFLELTIPTNLYCVTEDPNQQIRGSVNAPRPEGDDTAGPPPDYDPNARTVKLDE